MRRAACAAVTCALALAAPRIARADDVVTYHADGAAPAASEDDKAGRTAALDAAFQSATRDALADLAAADAIAAKADVVDAEIVRRARLWVASFKVTRQALASGTLTVSVDVRIDDEKLRARLVELGVPVAAAPTAPTGPRAAVLLLRVTTVEGALATYGAGAQANARVPGAEPATSALILHGLTFAPASSTGAAATAGDGLPLSDDAARGYAGDGHATVAVIAGVEQGAPGLVRGTKDVAGVSRAQVRILDVIGGSAIGEAQAARGAIGTGAPEVSREATRAALLDAIAAAFPATPAAPTPGPTLALPSADQGEVLIRVRGATGVQVASIRTYLAGAQGVKSVTLRRLGAGEVVLGLHGVRADRTGALLRADTDLTLKVRVDADAVEVSL